jgi:hypothetical protein
MDGGFFRSTTRICRQVRSDMRLQTEAIRCAVEFLHKLDRVFRSLNNFKIFGNGAELLLSTLADLSSDPEDRRRRVSGHSIERQVFLNPGCRAIAAAASSGAQSRRALYENLLRHAPLPAAARHRTSSSAGGF